MLSNSCPPNDEEILIYLTTWPTHSYSITTMHSWEMYLELVGKVSWPPKVSPVQRGAGKWLPSQTLYIPIPLHLSVGDGVWLLLTNRMYVDILLDTCVWSWLCIWYVFPIIFPPSLVTLEVMFWNWQRHKQEESLIAESWSQPGELSNNEHLHQIFVIKK